MPKNYPVFKPGAFHLKPQTDLNDLMELALVPLHFLLDPTHKSKILGTSLLKIHFASISQYHHWQMSHSERKKADAISLVILEAVASLGLGDPVGSNVKQGYSLWWGYPYKLQELPDVLTYYHWKGEDFDQNSSIYVKPTPAQVNKLIRDDTLMAFGQAVKKEGKFALAAPIPKDDGWYAFKLSDLAYSARLSANDLLKSNDLQLQKGLSINLDDSPHILISSPTGGGKTMLLFALIVQLVSSGSELFIADPKNMTLGAYARQYLQSDYHAEDPEQIVEMVEHADEVMNERKLQIQDHIDSGEGAAGGDYRDFGMKKIVIVIDEVASCILSLDKKTQKRFTDALLRIINQGRQLGVFVILATQQARAEIIPTSVRTNCSTCLALLTPDTQSKAMIFGASAELPQIERKRGQGFAKTDASSEIIPFDVPEMPTGKALDDFMKSVFEPINDEN